MKVGTVLTVENYIDSKNGNIYGIELNKKM
jgi:hypothetical protein